MKERRLEFNSNNCLINCSTGWEIDKEGYKGVWCTNDKGKRYFIRKGESVLDAKQRLKNPYDKDIDSAVMKIYSTVRKKVEEIGFAYKPVNVKGKTYIVKINKSNDDFDYEIVGEK